MVMMPVPHAQRDGVSDNYHVSDADEEPDEVEVNENSGESDSDSSQDGEYALHRKEVVQTTRWQGTRLRSGSMRGLGRRENIVPPVAKDGDSM